MAITESTGTFSSGILIGNTTTGATPTPTLVNGVAISSCLELQSTTKAFTLPRMTTAQINAIPTTVDGMTAYSTDIKTPAVKMAGAWQYPIGIASVTLTAADVDSLHATPIQLLPSLPAGLGYVVYMATAFLTPTLTVFVGPGNIDIYFDGAAKESALSSPFENEFIVGATGGRITYIGTNGDGSGIDPTETNGFALKIRNTNVTEFTSGGTATIKITVWYSIMSD